MNTINYYISVNGPVNLDLDGESPNATWLLASLPNLEHSRSTTLSQVNCGRAKADGTVNGYGYGSIVSSDCVPPLVLANICLGECVVS